ncbi:MAG: hypothetical protein HC802_12980 [Caldilineaceae bacterium]|nr:hypothetical protein [Caldilineaceae bacterium]
MRRTLPWIYAVCGLTALYQIYRVWQVRIERRQAVFSLEREKAMRDIYNIFTIAMLLLITMGVTYFFSNTLAIAVEPLVSEALRPTPGVPFVPTPTSTPLPSTPTPTITPTPGEALATATPFETPAGLEETALPPTPTPVPAPVVQAPSCPDPRSIIRAPGVNQNVSGAISVVGTASHNEFQYYKVEFAPGANAAGGFVYLGGGNSQVFDSTLLGFDTNSLGNGAWTLRLIVVDQTGNFPPPCQVTINVQN